MINVYLDIETVPTDLEWVREKIESSIEPPGNMSRPETIAAWAADRRPALVDRRLLETALDGTYGRICAICWSAGDICSVVCGTDERALLSYFFEQISLIGGRCCFVGHNISGFDIPFIWKRARILGTRPPTFFPDGIRPFLDSSVFDTMVEWCGKRNEFVSLDALCRVLGIGDKSEMDGSMVWDLYRAERFEEIADYCFSDVKRVFHVYSAMKFWAQPEQVELHLQREFFYKCGGQR